MPTIKTAQFPNALLQEYTGIFTTYTPSLEDKSHLENFIVMGPEHSRKVQTAYRFQFDICGLLFDNHLLLKNASKCYFGQPWYNNLDYNIHDLAIDMILKSNF